MLTRLIGWLLSVVLAFSVGVGVRNDKEPDSELQQKVQDHMDVIIDEAAGIVDDVTVEVRKDERVQKAEEFADDVKEIIDNTREDIDAHFGKDEDAEADDAEAEETADEAADEEADEVVEEEVVEEAEEASGE